MDYELLNDLLLEIDDFVDSIHLGIERWKVIVLLRPLKAKISFFSNTGCISNKHIKLELFRLSMGLRDISNIDNIDNFLFILVAFLKELALWFEDKADDKSILDGIDNLCNMLNPSVEDNDFELF